MEQDKALVVFTDSTYNSLKVLKPSFQHVCVLLKIGDKYLVVDPKGSGTDIYTIPQNVVYSVSLNTDICTVVECDVYRHNKKYLPSVLTCVTTVKRILGIRAWWVQTPYQLYKYINKRKGANHGLNEEDKEQYGQDTH